MDKAKLRELYEKYDLQPADFFKHQHYTIITRQGIDKIQAKEQIYVDYEVIQCQPNFAVFKATSASTFFCATSNPGASNASADTDLPNIDSGSIVAPAPNPAIWIKSLLFNVLSFS